jgi:glycosyltransferase involved in cell wall biosynthesis
VVEHERTGFIVESAGEMAEAIRRVDLIDPETCRQSARRRFSADRMTAEYLERYQWLARSGSRRSMGAAD